MIKLERCLVCGLAPQDSEAANSSVKTEKIGLLEKQLRVIFVLRKLLELPTESLEKCFQLSGGKNPSLWIAICEGQCQEIVDNAQTAYQEMCRARRNLEICRKEIQDKIRLSSAVPVATGNQKHKDYKADILEIIQESVNNDNDTGPVCDFPVGDQAVETIKLEISEVTFVQPKLELESSPAFEAEEPEKDTISTESAPVNVQPADMIKCPQCDFLGKTKNSVWRHKALVHPKGDGVIFQCDHCDKSFNTRARLTMHNYNNHRRPAKAVTIFCPHCDYSTDFQFSLSRHIRIRHDKSHGYSCDICDSKFKQQHRLRQHLAYSHNKCSVKKCEKVCESRENLRDHQINCHGKEVDVFKCGECGLLYKTRGYLQEHVRSSHRKGNEAVHKCSQCGKVCLTRARLTTHIGQVHKKTAKRKEEKEIKKEVEEGDDLILGI